MSFTSQFITESEFNGYVEQEIVDEMYQDSEEALDNGNYAYRNAHEVNSVDKKQDWIDTFKSYAIGSSAMKATDSDFVHKLIGVFQDGYLLALEGGWYDPSDKSWNCCRGILRKDQNGSKSYIYKAPYNEAKIPLVKTLGAIKQHSWVEKGASIAFRLQQKETYADVSSVLDFDSVAVQTVNQHYQYVIPTQNSIATEDGISESIEEHVAVDYYWECEKVSVNYK